jgi:hypothetical protein
MPTTDDGSFPLAAQQAEAAAAILAAACEEQQAKYGTLPNTDPRTPVPDGFDTVGGIRFLRVIKRVEQPVAPSTVMWVWPYQDPQLLDGWTLSELETMFPFFEPVPGL